MPDSLTSALARIQLPASYQISDSEFTAIRDRIYREAGISLSESKRALVCSRLVKRLRELGLTNYAEYHDYLEFRDPDGAERQEMINCLTTNKTDFFREPHHFAFLRETVFPEVVKRAARGEPRKLRIWSAACSMGDEPYSIAMEAMDYPGFARGWDIRILASDISTRVLRTAQLGAYPLERIAPVATERRQKYFLKGTGKLNGLCQVRPEVKRLIAFRQVNLVEGPWPIRTNFDIIFCRNVIIYFDQPTQRSVLQKLAERLHGGGYLMLGHSESPYWLAEVLSPLGQTMYRKPREGKIPVVSVRPSLSQRPLPAHDLLGNRRALKASPARALAESCSRPMLRQTIVAGETCASRGALEICTLLGSCIAACLYDPLAHIGGMNHFMLPGHDLIPSASARYGIHAMELLINGIMRLGGDRRRLQAKVFGGANVLSFSESTSNVGSLNIEFVRSFLNTDRIPIVSERLGGDRPVQVQFHTATGRAFVRVVQATRGLSQSEMLFAKRAADRLVHPSPDNITLY
jgi:chemotaxis protein methyltransferase CheR